MSGDLFSQVISRTCSQIDNFIEEKENLREADTAEASKYYDDLINHLHDSKEELESYTETADPIKKQSATYIIKVIEQLEAGHTQSRDERANKVKHDTLFWDCLESLQQDLESLKEGAFDHLHLSQIDQRYELNEVEEEISEIFQFIQDHRQGIIEKPNERDAQALHVKLKKLDSHIHQLQEGEIAKKDKVRKLKNLLHAFIAKTDAKKHENASDLVGSLHWKDFFSIHGLMKDIDSESFRRGRKVEKVDTDMGDTG